MADDLILVRNVSHTFADGTAALANVSFSIPAGEFSALVGPSGVGKTSLLRIVGGLLTPQRGEIRVDGQPPDQIDRPIGIVFQQNNLMPWRTAADNVRLPLELQGVPRDEAADRVAEMLALVGLHGFEQSYPAQLSGGMAQRIALARALIHRPPLLLLDEPFGALDALTRERMGQELLRIWQQLRVTVLMVTHDIREAVRLADRVFVLNGYPGTVSDVLTVALPRPRSIEMETAPLFHEGVARLREAIRG